MSGDNPSPRGTGENGRDCDYNAHDGEFPLPPDVLKARNEARKLAESGQQGVGLSEEEMLRLELEKRQYC